ncbi:MAG: hypothetical protein WC307_06935 [Candidatus Nanoarchaeia archaeon]|jgi:hypothetical protein
MSYYSELMGWLGFICLMLATNQKTLMRLRVINLIAGACLLLQGVFLGSYALITTNIVVSVINLRRMIKERKQV